MKILSPFAWESTPLINVGWQSGEPFTDQELTQIYDGIMRAHYIMHPNAKQALKRLLGKQKFTWLSWIRHWVWENDNWRVFASSEGMAFEVKYGMTKAESLTAFQDFLNKIGANNPNK